MTTVIKLKVDLSTIKENKIYGDNKTIDYPQPMTMNFVWLKKFKR